MSESGGVDRRRFNRGNPNGIAAKLVEARDLAPESAGTIEVICVANTAREKDLPVREVWESVSNDENLRDQSDNEVTKQH